MANILGPASLVEFKGQCFLITEQPSNESMAAYVQVRRLKITHLAQSTW